MTRRHRRHSVALKRMIVEAYLDDEDIRADLIPEYEARIAALERLVGKQALEIEFIKGARTRTPQPRNARISVVTGPLASQSEEGASS